MQSLVSEAGFQRKSFESAEKLLTSTGKWAIRSIQLNGYFLLSIRNQKMIACKKSRIFIIKVFISILGTSLYFYIASEITIGVSSVEVLSTITKITYGILTYLIFPMTSFFRIRGIFRTKQDLKIWKKNVILLQDFLQLNENALKNQLQVLQKWSRTSFIIFCCLTGFAVTWMLIAETYYLLKFDTFPVFTIFGYSSQIWQIICFTAQTFFLTGHTFFGAIWISFQLKFYKCLFKVVSVELDQVEQKLVHHVTKHCEIGTIQQEYNSTLDLNYLYRMYIRAEQAVNDFCEDYSAHLIIEAFITLLTIITYVFISLTVVRVETYLEFFVSLILIAPAICICASFHSMCSNGSQLTDEAGMISKKLHSIYAYVNNDVLIRSSKDTFAMDLQMFCQKTSQPVQLIISNYFNLHQSLFSVIVTAATSYVTVMLQFGSEEIKNGKELLPLQR